MLAMYADYAEAAGSACMSRQVGAAIVSEKGEIIGLGKNGSLRSDCGSSENSLPVRARFRESSCMVKAMKKQSERADGADRQLVFELEVTKAQPPDSASLSATVRSKFPVQDSVLDLTPRLQLRARENDRALLKAVQNRAAHLSDCLRKQP